MRSAARTSKYHLTMLATPLCDVARQQRPIMDARALVAEITRSETGAYGDDMALADVENWDSLKAVRLVLRIEKAVGRPLTESDIESLRSIGDVDRILGGSA